MVRWLLWGKARGYGFLDDGCKSGFNYQQKFGLVNVKFKWVKDSALDAVVAGGRNLKAACILVAIICSDNHRCLPVYHLSRCRGQLGLPHELKISTFIRKYPSIFEEFQGNDNGGTRVPWFRVTPEAENLHKEELMLVQQKQVDIVDRLRKLLMLTKDRMLPLQTIDQLKWDLGLPFDYHNTLITRYPEFFALVRLPDDRVGLKLQFWDSNLTISHLQKSATFQKKEEDYIEGNLAFPIGFTRGFGLKRKCMDWLEEWQKLLYTSPYSDASHLDPRTDVSEKRVVGVFHELLHLTIQKKTERQNVSNLRKPLGLPQKFSKVFERHPGIFYISKKSDTQTVVLREAYACQELIEKHPIADIRERYARLMAEGLLSRSRGLFKKNMVKDACDAELADIGFYSEGELEHNLLSDYESEDTT